ncbi:MAG: hypothetical protein R3181_14060 [Rubricoccaceae bacterium]|nr:hypothetical protein [Rubricoccaceae bacterium]
MRFASRCLYALVGVVSFGLLLALVPLSAAQQPGGTAVVVVETTPEAGGDTLRFEGTPSGQLPLRLDQPNRLAAENLEPGPYTSTLAAIGPELQAQGYALRDIRCDDGASATPSVGNLATQTATFNLDDGETVTCVFELSTSSCVCPEAGTWAVDNHPGTMACTGAVSMTLPLAPASGTGTLDIRDGCATVYAEDLGEGTAPITMRRSPDCRYRGTVGGEEGGIPMEIHFTWDIQDPEHITGNLESTVSEQGMTCTMARTFELRYQE